MRITSLVLATLLAACGGEAPTTEPAHTEPAAEPAAEPAHEEPVAEPVAEPAAEPAATAGDAPDLTAMSEADALAWLMTAGENVYLTGGNGGAACVTCHQANGMGVAGAFPPLVGSGEFYGDCTKHAGLIINGLNGPVEVQGVTYNAVMPPQANLSNHEIAAVITYVRKSWGNDDGHCMPAQVAAAR